MTAKQHASRAVRSFGIAIVVTVGVVAAILLAIALDDGGADLSYKTLDYDVQVQSNGFTACSKKSSSSFRNIYL